MCRVDVRPTQWIIYVLLLENRFQKSFLLIVQHTYLKSRSEDLFSKIWFSAQDHAVLHLLLNIVGFFISARQESVGWKSCVPEGYQFPRGISVGPALKHFCMIHRGGRIESLDIVLVRRADLKYWFFRHIISACCLRDISKEICIYLQKKPMYSLLSLECHLNSISDPILLRTWKKRPRDLDHRWDLRTKKWRSKCNRLYIKGDMQIWSSDSLDTLSVPVFYVKYQKSPVISGSFAEMDLQLKAFHASFVGACDLGDTANCR